MKDRIRPGYPLSGSLGPDLSRPLSPSRTKVFPTLSLMLFLLCSILEPSQKGGFTMESTKHVLPVTPKQIAYARSLALRNRTLLPWEVQQDRRSLSAWIAFAAALSSV